MDNILAKEVTGKSGYLFITVGIFFEIIIIAGSFTEAANTQSPLLYSLTQIFPLLFIDLGFYYLRKRKSALELESFNKIDKHILTAKRGFQLYNVIKGILIAIFVIVFATSVIPLGFNQPITIGTATILVFASPFIYLTLRLATKSMFSKIKNKNVKNPIAWIAPIFTLFGIYLIYSSINAEPRWLRLTGGIFSIVASLVIIYYITKVGGIKYEIRNDSFILQIPLNPFQFKPVDIKFSEILELKKLSHMEAISMQESYKMQSVGFEEMTDSMKFVKGEISRPRYYYYCVGNNIVYIKGKNFRYLIELDNPDELIGIIKNNRTIKSKK